MVGLKEAWLAAAVDIGAPPHRPPTEEGEGAAGALGSPAWPFLEATAPPAPASPRPRVRLEKKPPFEKRLAIQMNLSADPFGLSAEQVALR